MKVKIKLYEKLTIKATLLKIYSQYIELELYKL